MGISDRFVYRAVYTGINDVARDDRKKGKTEKRTVPLTVFNKLALLNATYGTSNLAIARPIDATKLSKGLRETSAKLGELLVSGGKAGTPSGNFLARLAKFDADDLTKLVDEIADAVERSDELPNNGKFVRQFVAPTFGYLHLERLRFTPVGTERGELLYTLALAPGEEVTLVQRSWAKTKREFTEIVDNLVEKSLTTQRTESLELSEATQNQFQFGAELSSSFQGSGKIGVVDVSGSASTSLSSSYATSRNESIKRGQQLTEQATARSKQEHKITFQVSTETGAEAESRRLIRNPNRTHAVRYDYFRYMRRWRVDLERYGVRLMMDLMVPDPGEKLRVEYTKRQSLENAANEVFTCPFTASNIDLANLPPGVDAKPSSSTLKQADEYSSWRGDDDNKTYNFTVPPGYRVVRAIARDVGGSGDAKVVGSYAGATGIVGVNVKRSVGIDESVAYSVEVTIEPTPDTIAAWEASVVEAMCAVARAEFETKRALAASQLASLQTRAAETPTLILRKDERHEIMRGVAARLVQPAAVMLANAPADLVRFIHEAFEWENMTYFLYPYFWRNIPDALQIDHPDSLRRDFLRAGWARVLVPIRPGYEDRLMNYAYSGSVAGTSPAEMRSIAKQVADEMRTTFALEATPDGDMKENCEIVATWHEYTPTDGVDIDVRRIEGDVGEPMLNTELSLEMARREVDIRAVSATAAVREKVGQRIDAMATNAEIVLARDGEGDEIHFVPQPNT